MEEKPVTKTEPEAATEAPATQAPA